MAPVRRYLRISKYSVLECRIYLDNPSLAQSWLLNPRYEILPKVIESIRPLVLPKLREEKERELSRKKSTKKKKVKDVIVHDEFEVSMFLMETDTRHSLLTKKKHFRERMPARMQSNASRLIGENSSSPASLDDPEFQAIRVEDSEDEEEFNLADIPSAEDTPTGKRDRVDDDEEYTGASGRDATDAIDVEEDGLFVPPPKRRREGGLGSDSDEDDEDKDKKKLAMDVSYEGFAIYGRVLCLVVKKRQARAATGSGAGGQAQMENWIASTQVPVGQEESF